MQYDECGDADGPLCAADGNLWQGPFAFFETPEAFVTFSESDEGQR